MNFKQMDNRKINIGGFLLTILMAAIAILSFKFRFENNEPGPIPLIVGLFLLGSMIYIALLHDLSRLKPTRTLLLIIWGFAFLMRIVLLFSTPILELDIYRYMWDGEVVSSGHSPYEFSPQQVIDSATQRGSSETRLSKLAELSTSSEAVHTILSRVHYSEITTIYPPVSQFVFAVAAFCTPENSNISTHLIVMKFWIIFFDLFTIWGIQKLLALNGLSPAWILSYAWCPLILKEFANSGHLDSIAVCFMVWACFFLLKSVKNSTSQSITPEPKKQLAYSALGILFFSLSVGAKLFPVILLPILFIFLWKIQSFKRASFVTTATVLVSMLICSPMFIPRLSEKIEVVHETQNSADNFELSNPTHPSLDDSPPLPIDYELPQKEDSKTGIKEFLSHWEMNDFLFMLIHENLKPNPEKEDEKLWFSILPESFVEQISQKTSSITETSSSNIPFMLTRLITLFAFGMLIVWLCIRIEKKPTQQIFLESVFLTIAWFFLLAPTQNPWYWTWALPFIPFARNKVWHYLAGLLFIYYLRFWFIHQWKSTLVPGTNFNGGPFFDFVITWIEFGPWLIALIIVAILRKRFRNTSSISELKKT